MKMHTLAQRRAPMWQPEFLWFFTIFHHLGFYHLSSFRCLDLRCSIYYENTLPTPPRSEH